jgi:3',5'-cyclic AMP phosphodiesterase CpdA
VKLAHVSDLHVPSRWRRAPWLYLGKRLIGTLNYKLKRAREYPEASIRALVSELAGDPSIDHVAITGDLTNVSLPEEFTAARAYLEPLLARPGFVSIVPGNHDRYTYGSDWGRTFEQFFGAGMTSELDAGAPFPFVRFRKGVAIVGLDTAVATPPFMATGRLGEAQRERLTRLLEDPAVRDASFRVALLHHPPRIANGGRDRGQHRLTDDRELLAIARAKNVSLLLHGHVHDAFRLEDDVPAFGAGSSTRVHHRPEKMGGINVYSIEGGKLVGFETRTFDPATGRYSGRR